VTRLLPVPPEPGDRFNTALPGMIDNAFSSTCLRSVVSRSFLGRLLRQRNEGLTTLESCDDVLLVYDPHGARRVERWYEGKLSSFGSAPDRVTIVPAGRASGWRLPDPVEVMHLYLPSSVLRLVAERDLGIDPARVEFLDSFAVEDPIGSALARAIFSVPDASDPLDRLLLDGLGQALAAHLLRRHATLPPSAKPCGEQPNALSPERLRRVCDYVEAHLDEEVTLQALSDAACLSPYHLSRCFRRSTGTTLHTYVMSRRIEGARKLLADRKLTLAEIAYRCGFASQSHFTAVFKKSLGMTPGRYRRAAIL